MDKADRKQAIAIINEGMLLAQAFIERAQNKRQLLLGEALYNSFYAMELLYKDAGITPERKW